jgi:hypothetical protein
MNAVQEVKTVSGTDVQILPTFPESISISVGSGLSNDEVIFKGLAENWQQATQHLSVLAKRYEHPSYRAILEMGQGIAPFILTELQRAPDRWFDALEQLTGTNPAKDASTFEDAVALWIKWGKDNKYIP